MNKSAHLLVCILQSAMHPGVHAIKNSDETRSILQSKYLFSVKLPETGGSEGNLLPSRWYTIIYMKDEFINRSIIITVIDTVIA